MPVALWLAAAAGCATDPYAQLETRTPTLSETQVAELRSRAKTAAELGVRLHITDTSAGFEDVNEITVREPVTASLLKMPGTSEIEPATKHRLPVIFATVNGREKTRVLLDSGSNRNLLGYTLARAVEAPIVAELKPIAGMGIGGAMDNFAGIVPVLRIGTLEMRKVVTLIGPDAQALQFTSGFWGNTQVMIVGLNAFRGLSYVCIDNVRGRVMFEPRAAYEPLPASEFVTRVPLRWEGELPFVEVVVDGRTGISCLVDTGGDYGLILPRRLAQEYGYWKPGSRDSVLSASHGVGGAALTTRYIVKEARVGGQAFVKVPGRTTLVGPEPGGGTSALLGNLALRQHRVTFDFRRNVLWLER